MHCFGAETSLRLHISPSNPVVSDVATAERTLESQPGKPPLQSAFGATASGDSEQVRLTCGIHESTESFLESVGAGEILGDGFEAQARGRGSRIRARQRRDDAVGLEATRTQFQLPAFPNAAHRKVESGKLGLVKLARLVRGDTDELEIPTSKRKIRQGEADVRTTRHPRGKTLEVIAAGRFHKLGQASVLELQVELGGPASYRSRLSEIERCRPARQDPLDGLQLDDVAIPKYVPLEVAERHSGESRLRDPGDTSQEVPAPPH